MSVVIKLGDEPNAYPPGAIWPADDEDAVQIREVYSRYGLAMYQAQVLEHGIVNAVIVARMLPTIRGHPERTAWEAAFDRAYDAELAKTFGNMLRALATLGLPDDLMDGLRVAKVERDRLAHRFFREHDEDFLGRSGRTAMIAECERAIEAFAAVDAELEAFMRLQRERYGITEEWIEGHLVDAIAAAEAKQAARRKGDTAG